MGSSPSIQKAEEQKIEELKRQVQIFDDTITSKRYEELQKDLIDTYGQILKITRSVRTRELQKCYRILNELEECLKILVSKATQPTFLDAFEEQSEDVLEGNQKRDATTTLALIQKEVENIQVEIENAIASKDFQQYSAIKAKLKIFFGDLAIIKFESGSTLDVERTQLMDQLACYYKGIRRDRADITAWLNSAAEATKNGQYSSSHSDDSDFVSDFGGSSGKSGSIIRKTANQGHSSKVFSYCDHEEVQEEESTTTEQSETKRVTTTKFAVTKSKQGQKQSDSEGEQIEQSSQKQQQPLSNNRLTKSRKTHEDYNSEFKPLKTGQKESASEDEQIEQCLPRPPSLVQPKANIPSITSGKAQESSVSDVISKQGQKESVPEGHQFKGKSSPKTPMLRKTVNRVVYISIICISILLGYKLAT